MNCSWAYPRFEENRFSADSEKHVLWLAWGWLLTRRHSVASEMVFWNFQEPANMSLWRPLNYQEPTWLTEKLFRMWNPHPRISRHCGHKSGNAKDGERVREAQTRSSRTQNVIFHGSYKDMKRQCEFDSWNMPAIALPPPPQPQPLKEAVILAPVGNLQRKLTQEWGMCMGAMEFQIILCVCVCV